jgi:hypothetical protein
LRGCVIFLRLKSHALDTESGEAPNALGIAPNAVLGVRLPAAQVKEDDAAEE